jgi:hypothetical protein
MTCQRQILASTQVSHLHRSNLVTRVSEPPPIAYKASSGRSALALEHQINELSETFKAYKHASEERYKTSEGTLARILEAVNCSDPSSHLSASQTPTLS